MPTPPIVNLNEVPLIEHFAGHDDFAGTTPDKARGGLWGKVGQALGSTKLGCSLTVVPAGKTMFPYHLHHANEEMIHVLSGTGTLRYEGAEAPISAGDMILFPAGSAHQIRNTSDAELRYLAYSTLIFPEVCEYPDSGKVSAMPAPDRDRFHITRKGDKRLYWDGETLD